VTDPVRPPSRADQAWTALAAELTPAKSLARVDTVTARAVATITVVGVLLTGLGALSITEPGQAGLARALAAATVITAALAVGSALAAQVLTITRRLNPNDLVEVKGWYRRQFRTRAYPTQAATILLLLAALLAGATATAILTIGQMATPTITVTQTRASPADGTSTVQVSVTFRALAPGQVATVTVTAAGHTLARAIAAPAPDGNAAVTLTASHIATGQPVTLTARTPGQACQATLPTGTQQATLTCRPR